MDSTETGLILPFDAPAADLFRVGGKALNLIRLTRAGFPVPGGFILTTDAYRQFVEFNQLAVWLKAELDNLDIEDTARLNESAKRLRTKYKEGALPDILATEIRDAYLDLRDRAVAVRSSATAEDLPDLSFAGQQDTFLNVKGQEALLRAIADCWGSLWSARAISYRSRNQVDHREVALAVVVQDMVEARASGVLFTANPLNGIRRQTAIDATLGLGEALVGGHVEPDHYVVEPEIQQILSKSLGAKAVAMRSHAGGGIRTVKIDAKDNQALPDPVILELAELGHAVGSLYGTPQDIEWAWADQKLHLLQSRPITNLFPIPGPDDGQDRVFGSFGAVQGMLDPFTPLGMDILRLMFSGLSGFVGLPTNHNEQQVLYSAGERL